ncbi:MAG TPA: glycogen debranching N-terminal domain-containing protein [Trebonia sp.]
MPHGGEASEFMRAVDGPTLMLCTSTGDVERHFICGLYQHDTRYLSEWRLLIQGQPLDLLTSKMLDGSRQLFYLTNKEVPGLPVQGITVRRQRTVGAGMAELITVTSHLQDPVTLRVELVVDADFSAVGEVRRGYAESAGSWRTEAIDGRPAVRWFFDHERFAAVSEVSSSEPARVIVADRPPSEPGLPGAGPTRPARFRYDIKLAPHQEWQTQLQVAFECEREALEPLAERLAREPSPPAAAPVEPAVRADWWVVQAVCDGSLRDLNALRFEAVVDGHQITVPAAGIPLYLAIIGRDALWTAYQALPFVPELAAGALAALANVQATERDPNTDAEPGKILHEIRFGKLTALGERPFRPYYGTVDATMLFLIVLAEHWQVTGDTTLCRELRGNALAALDWMDTYADLDGDGFIEYQRSAPTGSPNHCWKDSPDSIRFADGRVAAEGPIAVCEAQGYAYAARLRTAEVAEEIWGDAPLAGRLREDARRLYDKFNDRFWIDRRGGYYALALDRDKTPVDSVTSNMGHLLWSGIVPQERADAVAARLTGPAMSCGWGVRTMSSQDHGFHPISYHNGSIWPHDNAITAAGLARYGFRDQAAGIAVAIFEAAEHFEMCRMPEVYAGHPRSEAAFPVWYPKATSPQGWAAAAPLLLIRTLLGLEFSRGQDRADPFIPPRMHGLYAVGPPAVGNWRVRTSGHGGYWPRS